MRKDNDGNDQLTRDQLVQLNGAAHTAKRWLNRMEERIDRIFGAKGFRRRKQRQAAWKADLEFSLWFGRSFVTNRQIRIVRRRIKRMQKFFKRGLTLVITNHQTWTRGCGSNAALTLAPRVYICPNFFGRGNETNATTLIHELTHRLVQRAVGAALPGVSSLAPHKALAAWLYFSHPIVNGKVVSLNRHVARAEVLAHNRAIAARRSPVNWALLARHLGTGVQPRQT